MGGALCSQVCSDDVIIVLTSLLLCCKDIGMATPTPAVPTATPSPWYKISPIFCLTDLPLLTDFLFWLFLKVQTSGVSHLVTFNVMKNWGSDPQSGELPCERWNPTQNVRYISSKATFDLIPARTSLLAPSWLVCHWPPLCPFLVSPMCSFRQVDGWENLDGTTRRHALFFDFF